MRQKKVIASNQHCSKPDEIFNIQILSWKRNKTKLTQYLKEDSFSGVFNRRHSLLSVRGPQLYNSEALPITYGQYVAIESADKLYNSVTIHFCASQKYVFHIGLKRVPNVY